MIKIMACFLIGVVTAGCNGIVKPDLSGGTNDSYFLVFSGFPVPYLYMASAVQWNDDYAVTTRHTPFIPNVTYSCSTHCDLVFIKHKANGHYPSWRAPRVGESITAVGGSPYLVTTTGKGKVYQTPFVNADEHSGDLYAIHDAPLVKGMSGGPVIANDGSVVGINIGFYSTTLNDVSSNSGVKGAERISIFIPYSIIQREWGMLQAKLTNPHGPKYAAK
ncbi:S1 family peptidase [Pseudomonas izuensis]|uniref:Trypsin-like peptidase domain-containing protein n=1 Tax=Pseudomonas izuensis TaxID=2684212 RepID=A0ABM7RPV1_9PSED|nr:serine protease [Pseudomonas izuensis]BCX67276.1 trypsin-like peptidase domain-containing protein [Pseudomonas izuensis]